MVPRSIHAQTKPAELGFIRQLSVASCGCLKLVMYGRQTTTAQPPGRRLPDAMVSVPSVGSRCLHPVNRITKMRFSLSRRARLRFR